MDRSTSKRHQGTLSRQEEQKLGRKIKKLLQTDRVKKVRRVGEADVLLLQDGKVEELWRTVRGWYKVMGDRTPKPCYKTMEAQKKEREELYGYMEPPEDYIPCNIARPLQTTRRQMRTKSSRQ